ncbi:hypothetical protein GGH95_003621 [Coemansia sp. RSA 1836]|nr:hypothetical protein GGH95_003621 [Coemansia sp. RSA 1836]
MHLSALAREFMLRHAHHYGAIFHNGVLLDALRKVDMDAAIGTLDGIQGTKFQVGVDAKELDAVAEMCTRRPHSDMELDWSSNGRPVASVYRQPYEAGYLTQLSATRVGIPNPEVFDAFVESAELVCARL